MVRMRIRQAAAALVLGAMGATGIVVTSGAGVAEAATSYPNLCGTNHFNFYNTTKRAHGYGDLKVFDSQPCWLPGGVIRAQFASGTKVTDNGSHVKCLWVRVRVNHLTGTASLPLGVSVSGSSATDGWYGHCRSSDASTSPAAFNLANVGYASRTITSFRLDIGSSAGPNSPIVYSTQTVY